MKIARFEHKGNVALGLVDVDDQTVNRIAKGSPSGDPTVNLLESILEGSKPVTDRVKFALEDVRLLPPIAQPSKNVLCVGKNYHEHAGEFSRSGFDTSVTKGDDAIPKVPIVFSKAACTMIGATDEIRPPWEITSKVDYEGELGVVIGLGGSRIKRDHAYEHVWGYTLINDVTARDLQANHKQWLLGKSIDTFCPIGPWIVSRDELDAEDLEIRTWVNGELRQQANTGSLIFDIPTIIETISASMTLSTGDIIATGTPAGVGIGFDPPRFLAPGDTVKISIPEIGVIENRVA